MNIILWLGIPQFLSEANVQRYGQSQKLDVLHCVCACVRMECEYTHN